MWSGIVERCLEDECEGRTRTGTGLGGLACFNNHR
nr:MAG TPA_asm: hypothetical protein [Caudoviricetes sp.]